MKKEKFLAKSNGINLRRHILNVKLILSKVLADRKIAIEKFFKIANDKDMFSIAYDSVEYHDDGKMSDHWQSWAKDKNKRIDSRHEIDSVLMNDLEEPITKFAILSHHGRMIYTECEDAFQKQKALPILSEFYKLNKLEKTKTIGEIALSNYLYNSGRYFLQISDKTASAEEENHTLERKEFNWEFPFDKKNTLQNRIMESTLSDVFFLKSATGTGKTAASLLYADRMIKSGQVDRVIFAMPSMFTSNSLYETIKESSIHHSNSKYVPRGTRNNIEYFYDRIFEWPITVTTIDYLLHVISQKTENSHLAMFNITNSIIIIDEADFYDDFVFANLKVAMEILKPLNTKFFIMSATFPQSYYSFFESIEYGTYGYLENTYSSIKKYNLKDVAEINVESINTTDTNLLLDRALGRKTIVYANTIRNSLIYYKYLSNRGAKVILYNSNFAQKDRVSKEREILDNFGKGSTKKDYDILIVTQIGEMSINITCDYMITEICPMDRLVQRIGRLGRFDEEQRTFDVIIPIEFNKKANKMTIYAHPYTNYIEDRFTFYPNKHLSRTIATINRVKGTGFSMQEMLDLVESVYHDGINFEDDSINNAKLFEKMFKDNWLFLPSYTSNEDEDSNTSWKTRNFYETRKVFITPIPNEIKNKYQYQMFKSQHTVDLAMNKINLGITLGLFIEKEILIADAPKKIVQLVNKDDYTYLMGVTDKLYV